VCLLEGKLDEAITVVALVVGIPIEIVARAFYAASVTPLLVVARSAGFSRNGLRLLLKAKLGRTPPEMLLKDAYSTYESLSVVEAKRLLRMTVARASATTPTRH
jgi:hypothetical protein